MVKIRSIRALASDQKGIAAVEFALIGGTFLVAIMGAFDLGHTMYMGSVLQGTVQKAARDSSLQTGSDAARQTALDTKVRTEVLKLNHNATVTFSRRFYRTFTSANAAAPETLNDGNSNGRCDNGESYSDANNNNVWDSDGGNQGQGGAQDVVVYSANVTYPRLFPMAGLVGLPDDVNITATTVLQNQPYGEQGEYTAATVRNCPA